MVKESEDRVHIEATIYVERDSQKELSLEKAVKVKVGKRARRDRNASRL